MQISSHLTIPLHRCIRTVIPTRTHARPRRRRIAQRDLRDVVLGVPLPGRPAAARRARVQQRGAASGGSSVRQAPPAGQEATQAGRVHGHHADVPAGEPPVGDGHGRVGGAGEARQHASVVGAAGVPVDGVGLGGLVVVPDAGCYGGGCRKIRLVSGKSTSNSKKKKKKSKVPTNLLMDSSLP